jgi:mono/diheme cytochrome c family protein
MILRPPRKLLPWYLLGSAFVLGLLVVAAVQDARRPWKTYQRAYIRAERAAASTPAERQAAANLRVGIRQITLPALERVDRCTTCHLAVENPAYADAEHPLRYHPHHDRHPFEEFGCTVCHRGQGLATTKNAAHGGVPFWDSPMLPSRYLSASCMACHEPDYLPGVPGLQEGRRLFENNGCLACHALKGEGGLVGPALDGVGLRRDIDWFIRHFKNPAAVSPGTSMPAVQLNDAQIEDLTLYVLGMTDPVTDPAYLSRRVLPTPEAGRSLYLSRGCIGCHALDGVGGDIGPDLTRLGRLKSASWLAFYIRLSHRKAPGPLVPELDLSPAERDAVAAFIMRLDDPEFVREAAPRNEAKPSSTR